MFLFAVSSYGFCTTTHVELLFRLGGAMRFVAFGYLGFAPPTGIDSITEGVALGYYMMALQAEAD